MNLHSASLCFLILTSFPHSESLWADCLTGHPFHVSVAEMEFNPQSGCLEVSLRVWPEDLEKALRQKTGKPVDLDSDPQVDKLIFAYLQNKIEVQDPEGKKYPLRWIGKELEIKQAWLYFEVKTLREPDDFTYSNRLFFELQDDQINMFHLRLNGRRASISFAKDQARHRLGKKDFVPIRNPFQRKSKQGQQ